MSSLTLNTFSGDTSLSALGNKCRLTVFAEKPTNPVDRAENEITHCYSWPSDSSLPQSRNSYSVQCYNQQAPIQCCGHGLLSAACYWLTDNKENLSIELLMNDDKLTAYKGEDVIWLRFPRIPCKNSEPPDWLDEVFADHPIISTAKAGDEKSYLVLQWPDNFDLRTIVPPLPSLALHTQRAIICTCRNRPNTSSDIQFRYFAPQYGEIEDTATGSAMRILIDFWQQADLRAEQVSAHGGLLLGHLNSQTVEVGGYCSITLD